MFFSLKKSFARQLLLLAGCSGLALLLRFVLEIQPRLRMNTEMLIRGVLGAVLCLLVLGLTHLILVLLLGRSQIKQVETLSAELGNLTPLQLLGSSIASSVAEETLFRAYIFSSLSLISIWLAFALNALIAFVCYFRFRAYPAISATKAIEATFYAALYAYNHSLFMVALAHCIVELVVTVVLTKSNFKWLNYVLSFRKHRFFARVFRYPSRQDT
jgi:membrane protease YdiL (CAAX protease family)